MVLLDDKVMCKNMRCRKRFDVSGVKTTAFIRLLTGVAGFSLSCLPRSIGRVELDSAIVPTCGTDDNPRRSWPPSVLRLIEFQTAAVEGSLHRDFFEAIIQRLDSDL